MKKDHCLRSPPEVLLFPPFRTLLLHSDPGTLHGIEEAVLRANAWTWFGCKAVFFALSLSRRQKKKTTTRRGESETSGRPFDCFSLSLSASISFSPSPLPSPPSFLPSSFLLFPPVDQTNYNAGAHMTTFHAASPSRVSFCGRGLEPARGRKEGQSSRMQKREREKKALLRLDQALARPPRCLFSFLFSTPLSFSLFPSPLLSLT